VVELDGVHHRLHANHLCRFFLKVAEVKIHGYGFGNPFCVAENVVGSHDVTVMSDFNCPVGSVSVNTCAIIRDEDCAFGSVQTCPPLQLSDDMLPNQRIDPSSVSHLSDDEKQQLFKVLDRFPDVFKDEPCLYKGVRHTVSTTPCLKKNDNDVAHYNFNAH